MAIGAGYYFAPELKKATKVIIANKAEIFKPFFPDTVSIDANLVYCNKQVTTEIKQLKFENKRVIIVNKSAENKPLLRSVGAQLFGDSAVSAKPTGFYIGCGMKADFFAEHPGDLVLFKQNRTKADYLRTKLEEVMTGESTEVVVPRIGAKLVDCLWAQCETMDE